jgi:hypothetical protein
MQSLGAVITFLTFLLRSRFTDEEVGILIFSIKSRI